MTAQLELLEPTESPDTPGLVYEVRLLRALYAAREFKTFAAMRMDLFRVNREAASKVLDRLLAKE